MSKRRGNFKFFSAFEYFSPKWRGIFGLVLWFLVGALIGNGIVLVILKFFGQQAAAEYGTLLSYPVMFIPPMIFAASRSRRREMSVGAIGSPLDAGAFAPLGGVVCALLVVVVTLAAGFATDAITAVMPEMPDNLKQQLESMTSGTLWINFLCVSVFAPLFEEWLCRGMVLRGLLDRGVRPVWAILFSAVFFGAIHLNIWQMVPAMILGAIFGYVYWKTRSLKLTMLMHFTNNTFALVCSHIDALKDMETWSDVLGTQLYWIVFCVALLLIALFFVTFRRLTPPASLLRG